MIKTTFFQKQHFPENECRLFFQHSSLLIKIVSWKLMHFWKNYQMKWKEKKFLLINFLEIDWKVGQKNEYGLLKSCLLKRINCNFFIAVSSAKYTICRFPLQQSFTSIRRLRGYYSDTNFKATGRSLYVYWQTAKTSRGDRSNL